MILEDTITRRYNWLRLKAASRFNVSPDMCHIGHLALEGMLEAPNAIQQIDGVTDQKETNISVATKVMRFASALNNCGLKPGDPFVIMAPNHLDMCVPYYACHCNGYAMCHIDAITDQVDLEQLFQHVRPKFAICQKSCFDKVKKSLEINDIEIPLITFDDRFNDMNSFTSKYKGTEVNYRPNVFDVYKTPAWLMLTSGTTGKPKVAVVTFATLYNTVREWWTFVPAKIGLMLVLVGCQWLSTLVYFISTPIKGFTRLQSSAPLNPQIMVNLINNYRPDATSWTPFLLAQFIQRAKNVCDMSSLQHIMVGGSALEKRVIDDLKEICNAKLYLAYGMTELLVPLFQYDEVTPFGSSGKPSPKYEFKLIRDDNSIVEEVNEPGELLIKDPGHVFFKGYLNDPEETRMVLSEDGWFSTGDLFRRDENNYYYFIERKKIIIKYMPYWLSPLQMEEVIKRHPDVLEACVIGLPSAKYVELPVAAIQKKQNATVEAQEIFDLMKGALSDLKQLHGGLFFVESFPTLVSGKINRKKVLEMAMKAERIMPPGSSATP